MRERLRLNPKSLDPRSGSVIIPRPSPPTPLAWEQVFNNRHPVEIDIGCGKGRFLIARAKAHPRVNFLGIDRFLKRLGKLNDRIVQEGIENIRLLEAEAGLATDTLIPPASVSTFFVLFPDPWPKRRHHRRRLFSPSFLSALHQALCPGGAVHVATDHPDYAIEIRKAFSGDRRFQETEAFSPTADAQTDFERKFLALEKTIHRSSYRRSGV